MRLIKEKAHNKIYRVSLAYWNNDYGKKRLTAFYIINAKNRNEAYSIARKDFEKEQSKKHPEVLQWRWDNFLNYEITEENLTN